MHTRRLLGFHGSWAIGVSLVAVREHVWIAGQMLDRKTIVMVGETAAAYAREMPSQDGRDLRE